MSTNLSGFKPLVVGLLILGSVLSLVATPSYAQKYTITVLGKLPGGTTTTVLGINNKGQAVGTGNDVFNFGGPTALPETSAILWNGSIPTNIQHGGNKSFNGFGDPSANAINDAGLIVGSFNNKDGALCWYADGDYCGVANDSDFSTLNAVNSLGHFVGSSAPDNPTGPFVAAFWTSPSSDITYLNVLPAVNINSYAAGINTSDTVVGTSFGAYPLSHATVWSGTSVKDLGTLGGQSSGASAINAAGRVVGWASTKTGAQHAALWQRGVVEDLGTLGGTASSAAAINTAGDIVGTSQHVGCCAYHAVIWPNDTDAIVDWNSELSAADAKAHTITSAVAINDKGEIAANGYNNKTYASESYVLHPTTASCTPTD